LFFLYVLFVKNNNFASLLLEVGTGEIVFFVNEYGESKISNLKASAQILRSSLYNMRIQKFKSAAHLTYDKMSFLTSEAGGNKISQSVSMAAIFHTENSFELFSSLLKE
jgi:hypothetical protein